MWKVSAMRNIVMTAPSSSDTNFTEFSSYTLILSIFQFWTFSKLLSEAESLLYVIFFHHPSWPSNYITHSLPPSGVKYLPYLYWFCLWIATYICFKSSPTYTLFGTSLMCIPAQILIRFPICEHYPFWFRNLIGRILMYLQ